MGQLDLIADAAAEKLAQKVASGQAAKAKGQQAIPKPEEPAPQVTPEMQAAQDQNSKNLANPTPAPTMNAAQAGTLGLPAQVPEVHPTEGEIFAATAGEDPATTRGGIPAPSNKDIQPPIVVSPEPAPVAAKAAGVAPSPKVVAQQAASAPTTKAMIAKVLSIGPGGVNTTPKDTFNFADLLKGAGGKLGDFLQRWGMGLQGAPTGMTQGDIQRAQQFELKKQQMQAEVMARQQAMENQYQTQRMQLQNQMNVANLPIEAKIQLQNQLAVLDAQYQNELRMLPLKIQQEFAIRGMSPGADPGAHFVGSQ